MDYDQCGRDFLIDEKTLQAKLLDGRSFDGDSAPRKKGKWTS